MRLFSILLFFSSALVLSLSVGALDQDTTQDRSPDTTMDTGTDTTPDVEGQDVEDPIVHDPGHDPMQEEDFDREPAGIEVEREDDDFYEDFEDDFEEPIEEDSSARPMDPVEPM